MIIKSFQCLKTRIDRSTSVKLLYYDKRKASLLDIDIRANYVCNCLTLFIVFTCICNNRMLQVDMPTYITCGPIVNKKM